MAFQVNVHEAKTRFSQLLRRVQQGEEVIIARAGRPVARLVPAAPIPARRVPGSAEGKMVIKDDFEAPLPESFLEEFER